MSIAEPHGFGSARGDLADRILDAARRLVVRAGARKLSLSDVATLAGVSRPTIYRYFVSKEDLINALGAHERRRFDAAMERAMIGVTGIVMTKLDGTARGGVLVPVAQASDSPIKLIGVGEGIDDLQPFDARAFSRSLVGLDG